MSSALEQWTEPGFLAEAEEWIRRHVETDGRQTTGDVAQIHVQPWSTVLRVPTDRGSVFFKANHDTLRHEAGLVAFLADRRPDFVPRPIAVDIERGWMLMADAGERMRELIGEERSIERWLELLPIYAGLQLDTVGSADELIALGAPDLRQAELPGRFAALLDEIDGLDGMPAQLVARARAQVGSVEEMGRRLAAFGVPDTIQHDDLNDGQVYVLDGSYLLLDWGDACVSHPFFSMSVALEGQIVWGVDDLENSVDVGPFRDAYLEPFAERLGSSMEDLREACALAVRLGWACRAANGHVAGEDPAPTVARLKMFLDGRV